MKHQTLYFIQNFNPAQLKFMPVSLDFRVQETNISSELEQYFFYSFLSNKKWKEEKIPQIFFTKTSCSKNVA